MPKSKVLVIEDDRSLSEILVYNLDKAGYEVSFAHDGRDGLNQAQLKLPDIILLDVMLPVIDGIEVCRRLRAKPETASALIIMLTAKTEEADQLIGFSVGADDYVTKPFSPRVLAARIRALLRREESRRRDELETTIDVHELSIHPGRHEATLVGRPLDLTYTEFALLQFLAKRPGWAYTRGQIVDAVKGVDYPVTERSVDVQVAGLRRKLGTHGHYIETVRGVGYRFRP